MNEEGFSRVVRHPFTLPAPDGSPSWYQRQYGWNAAVFANSGVTSKCPIQTFTPTIAGQALVLALQLSQDFAIETQDALTLLLTDTLPPSSPIQCRYSARMVYDADGAPDYLAHGPVTMVIDPYMPAESVMKAYREIQHQVFSGRDCRLPKADNLEWYAFATDNRRKFSVRWPRLYASWREARGETNDGNWRTRHKTMGDIKRWLAPMNYWATAYRYWKTDTFKREDEKRRGTPTERKQTIQRLKEQHTELMKAEQDEAFLP